MIGQNHLSEIIRDHLATFEVQVELGKELIDFEQDNAGVNARILVYGSEGHETENIACDWIVSAEGGRSKSILL